MNVSTSCPEAFIDKTKKEKREKLDETGKNIQEIT